MPNEGLGNSTEWNVSSALAQMQLGQMEETDPNFRANSPWTGGDTLSSDQIDRLLTKLNVGRPFLSEPKDVAPTRKAEAATQPVATPVTQKPTEEMTIQMKYHTNFELELTQYATDNKLSAKEENALRTLHYAPSLGVRNPEALQPKLAEIEAKALGKTGLSKAPEDPDSEAFFKQTVQFDYQKNVESNFRNAVNTAEPPLDDAKQAQLRQVLADPNKDEGVPPYLVALANQIRASANIQTKESFSITSNPAGPALWGGSPQSLNVAIYADQLQTVLNKMDKDIPKGPVKTALLDLLRLISSALATLQASIYEMETEKAMSMSKQQLGTKDMMDAQIAIRDKYMADMQAKQAEMAAQQAKANQMSGIMKIVGPIVIALSVAAAIASFGTATPATAVVSTIMLGLMIHDAANPDHAVMGMLTKAIADDMVDKGYLSRRDAMIVATVVVAVIVMAIMIGTALASAPSTVASSTAQTGSEAATKTLKEGASATLEGAKNVGGSVQISPSAPDASAVNTTSIEISAAKADAAAGAKVDIQLDAATQATAAAGNPTTVGAAAADTAGASFKAKMLLLGKILKIGSATVKAGAAGAGVASALIEQKMKEIQGEEGIISARASASDEKYNDLVEANQKLIDQLLKILASLTKWNESVSKASAKMWKDNKIDFPV